MEYVLLSIIMIIAGFLDSLAGGGGVLRLPAYLAFGVNPIIILGTNKLASTMGIFFSAYKLKDRLKVSKKLTRTLALLAFLFAALGAAISRLINPNYLKFLIIAVIPFTAYLMLSNKQLGNTETRRKIGIKKSNKAAKIIASLVALYDGFLGPGSGTMYAVFLTKYVGFDLVQATAMAKVLNFCSNFFALLFFLSIGALNIKLGLAMGVFSIIGNLLGVYVGKRHGAKVIRPLIIFVSFLIIAKFILDYFKA
ncbi:MAG: TSUP family transporter [Elusimicrobiota bacterium]|jgi:uncharacterized membrane protein YfcA|nr:TSUP family transporter [Elusimicrobiota bacterium]